MKLWEIKAQSLRLMFADSDIQFSEAEFTNGAIRLNANTAEKLVRMDDSIRRAIDLYYSYVGEWQRITEKELLIVDNVRQNYIYGFSSDFGFPTRVDILIYLVKDSGNQLAQTMNAVNFSFDPITMKLEFLDRDVLVYYTQYTDVAVKFRVFYRMKKLNLPYPVNELTFDLNTLFLPEEVQRKIPFYVKGELYEEDEASMAQNAKREYIAFCAGLRNPSIITQTKVKRSPIFGK
jgi:hypothetical protein